VVLINIWAFLCLYMGHFVPTLNGPCSCPPMGHDLGPNPTRYIGSCRPGTKIFHVVPCMGRAFFPFFGPAHQAQPKCTPILGSTKWDDHEIVKVILRSLVIRNPTQVQLICGDLRYKLMSPEEVIVKFVSFEIMIKDSKHIVNLEQGATSTPEVQPIAFKVTEEKKEESTPSRLPIDASKLDNEEMTLIIKSFR
jgi:hypothetical protein